MLTNNPGGAPVETSEFEITYVADCLIYMVVTCWSGIDVGGATATPGIAQFDGIVGTDDDGIYWNQVGWSDGALAGVI